jgi:hypothetical protein
MDLWSEQISKIALRFLRFARSSLVFGGEAAELHIEFTLHKKWLSHWAFFFNQLFINILLVGYLDIRLDSIF